MRFSSKSLLALAFSGLSAMTMASPLNDYNLILFGDFDVSGGSGHIHGTAFVGGDLNGQNPEFGQDLDHSITVDTLEVAGDLNANQVTVQAGYLAYGGVNNLNNINCNGNGLSGGACLRTETGLDAKGAALYSQLSGDSSYYAGLTETGSVNLGSKTLSYAGAATDLAVFNLSGADLFAQNSNWTLNFGAAKRVVINVSGDVIANGGGVNFNSAFNQANAMNILWNFYGASSVDLGSSAWFGSILAVDASVNTANDIDGTLVANTYIGNGQVHIANWNWCPPEIEVPEANIALLLVSGLTLVGLGRRRRRN